MALNIFSGARRIAAVCAVAGTLAAAVAVFTSRESLSRSLAVDMEGALVENSAGCSYLNELSEYVTTPKGRSATIHVCLWRSVRSIDESVIAELKRSAVAKVSTAELDRDADQQLATSRKEIAIIWAAALLALAILTWVIGWVVRGFMGIPQGKDSPPESRD